MVMGLLHKEFFLKALKITFKRTKMDKAFAERLIEEALKIYDEILSMPTEMEGVERLTPHMKEILKARGDQYFISTFPDKTIVWVLNPRRDLIRLLKFLSDAGFQVNLMNDGLVVYGDNQRWVKEKVKEYFDYLRIP